MAETKSAERKQARGEAAARQGGSPAGDRCRGLRGIRREGLCRDKARGCRRPRQGEQGPPYLYFKTKVELFKAVIRSVITSHFEVLRERMETTELSTEEFLKGPFLSFIQELVQARAAPSSCGS